MALETTATAISYEGNNSTSQRYEIPFSFLSTSHIRAIVVDSDDDETLLGGGDFTVTRYASGLGYLTTTAAYDDTHTLRIERVTPRTQPTILEDGALIGAKVVEVALDRQMMVVQEALSNISSQAVTAHASTHESGGVDEIEVAQDQVTNLSVSLAAKSNKALTINAQTGAAYQLTLADADSVVTMNNASPNTVTVPLNSVAAFVAGSTVAVAQLGDGVTSIVAASGVTIICRNGLALSGKGGTAALLCLGPDTWLLVVGVA